MITSVLKNFALQNAVKTIAVTLLLIILTTTSAHSQGGAKTTWRGLQLQSLFDSNFPVDDAVEILKRSPAPAISLVYDLYGKTTDNYIELIAKLKAAGKAPHIEMYTLCGPCRAPRYWTFLHTFHQDLNISAFQRSIVSDQSVRSDYVTLLGEIKDLINRYPELTYTIVPELEDNETSSSFSALYDIASRAFKGMRNVVLQRNRGFLSGAVRGLHLTSEIHTTDIRKLALLHKGDSVCFDGDFFTYPEEAAAKGLPDFTLMKRFVSEASRRGIDAYLWRPEWQGLRAQVAPPHSDARTLLSGKGPNFPFLQRDIELISQ